MTAAVYGESSARVVTEETPLMPANPYGASKMMAERCLADCAAVGGFNFAALWYFNVASADPKGRSGQPQPAATHLITALVEHALGMRPEFKIFGTDWPTRDGSAERDYIHGADLARAHLDLLRVMRTGTQGTALNVGYGRGATVFDVIKAVEQKFGNLPGILVGPAARATLRHSSPVPRTSKVTGWTPLHDSLPEIVKYAAEWAQRKRQILRD